MSTYSENNRSEETQDSVSVIQKILIEMGKSPSTYKKYAQKTVEEVVKDDATQESIEAMIKKYI